MTSHNWASLNWAANFCYRPFFICGENVASKASSIIKDIWKKTKDASLTALMNASDDIQSTSRDTVREWRNKPDFGETVYIAQDYMEITIKPKGNRKVVSIFGYVDLGTKPHIIMPKVPGTKLKFRTGYSARTQPIAQYNKGSGQSFGSWVTKAFVNHPGTKPRLFMKTAMEKLIPSLQVRVQQEITRKLA